MKTKIVSLLASTSIHDAVQMVIDHKFGTLTVIDELGRIVGVSSFQLA